MFDLVAKGQLLTTYVCHAAFQTVRMVRFVRARVTNTLCRHPLGGGLAPASQSGSLQREPAGSSWLRTPLGEGLERGELVRGQRECDVCALLLLASSCCCSRCLPPSLLLVMRMDETRQAHLSNIKILKIGKARCVTKLYVSDHRCTARKLSVVVQDRCVERLRSISSMWCSKVAH